MTLPKHLTHFFVYAKKCAHGRETDRECCLQ